MERKRKKERKSLAEANRNRSVKSSRCVYFLQNSVCVSVSVSVCVRACARVCASSIYSPSCKFVPEGKD